MGKLGIRERSGVERDWSRKKKENLEPVKREGKREFAVMVS